MGKQAAYRGDKAAAQVGSHSWVACTRHGPDLLGHGTGQPPAKWGSTASIMAFCASNAAFVSCRVRPARPSGMIGPGDTPSKIRPTITTEAGKIFRVTLTPHSTTDSLKAMIEMMEGVDTVAQRLVYKGNELQPGEPLANLDLEDPSNAISLSVQCGRCPSAVCMSLDGYLLCTSTMSGLPAYKGPRPPMPNPVVQVPVVQWTQDVATACGSMTWETFLHAPCCAGTPSAMDTHELQCPFGCPGVLHAGPRASYFPADRDIELLLLGSDRPAPDCANCKTVPAAVCCKNCEANLCTKCDEVVHAPNILKNHQRLHVADTEPSPSCPTHGHRMNGFCREHDELVCGQCYTLPDGAHYNHDCIMAESGAQLLSQEVEPLYNQLVRSAPGLNHTLSKGKGSLATLHFIVETECAFLEAHCEKLKIMADVTTWVECTKLRAQHSNARSSVMPALARVAQFGHQTAVLAGLSNVALTRRAPAALISVKGQLEHAHKEWKATVPGITYTPSPE
eukprot:gene3171-3699_t